MSGLGDSFYKKSMRNLRKNPDQPTTLHYPVAQHISDDSRGPHRNRTMVPTDHAIYDITRPNLALWSPEKPHMPVQGPIKPKHHINENMIFDTQSINHKTSVSYASLQWKFQIIEHRGEDNASIEQWAGCNDLNWKL